MDDTGARFDRIREELDRERAAKGKRRTGPLIKTLAQFVGEYVPASYFVDGLFQRHYCYSWTGMPGSGKSAVALRLSMQTAMQTADRSKPQSFGPHEIDHGRVLYIAKENPSDVRARLIGMFEKNGVTAENLAPNFLVLDDIKNLEKDWKRVLVELKAFGPVDLVVVDTAPSLFDGLEENSNVQMLDHAKRVRYLSNTPGRPCVLALGHPQKHPRSQAECIPRGAGSYIAELDGNFTQWLLSPTLTQFHWTYKLRGRPFEPLMFALDTIDAAALVDARGRKLMTVQARHASDEEAIEKTNIEQMAKGQLLVAIYDDPHGSIASWATTCRWTMAPEGPYEQGAPNKGRAYRVLKQLETEELVKRALTGKYALTGKGQKLARELKAGIFAPPDDDDVIQ
jgi:hypothetical protein